MSLKNFPRYPLDEATENYYISPEGLEQAQQLYDKNEPAKNTMWTCQNGVELPIRLHKKGVGSLIPRTLIDVFHDRVQLNAKNSALSVKKQGQWVTINYQQYYDSCKQFATALISLGIQKNKAVNIIGFNSPEWAIAFYGSMFGQYLPVGLYTTNSIDACKYVGEHSDAEIVICENKTYIEKYYSIAKDLPQLKYIVIWGEEEKVPTDLPEELQGKVMLWADLMKLEQSFKPTQESDDVNYRMSQVKPGHCCTLVYTSGTTGPPKGVMLSHDNYAWTAQITVDKYLFVADGRVSYLPLSHAAGQILDLIGGLNSAVHLYFADPSALQGTLVQYLQEVRPTFFLGVPRVWEKIEEKMKSLGASNSALKQKLGNWAKSKGSDVTYKQFFNKPLSFFDKLAKKIVFDNVKKALGLDQARFLIFGAAPLSTATRQYFLSLTMFLINVYGMSESAGPQTFQEPLNYDKFDEYCMSSTGLNMVGTEMVIYQPDKDGNGEICYRGRNRFMGYFKNEEATKKTIDQFGYLHSGDIGRLDKNGNLIITGRLKELIITAGGENVAPVLIENIVKEELPFISNTMLIGDQRKFLSIIITLKHEVDSTQKLKANTLSEECLKDFQKLGITAKNVQEAIKDAKLRKIIDDGIQRANLKAISKAQYIQRWVFLDTDFSLDGGELTPTLKLKRNIAAQKYSQQIESMYVNAKL